MVWQSEFDNSVDSVDAPTSPLLEDLFSNESYAPGSGHVSTGAESAALVSSAILPGLTLVFSDSGQPERSALNDAAPTVNKLEHAERMRQIAGDIVDVLRGSNGMLSREQEDSLRELLAPFVKPGNEKEESHRRLSLYALREDLRERFSRMPDRAPYDMDFDSKPGGGQEITFSRWFQEPGQRSYGRKDSFLEIK